jgi:hypothetical protein
MAGTVEDRQYPSGVLFGDTEIAQSGVRMFITSVEEFLVEQGAEAPPMLSQRLATAILSAAHGVISPPLGTPTMEWQNVRATGRLLIGSVIDAWTMKLEAARKTDSWPKVSMSTFL